MLEAASPGQPRNESTRFAISSVMPSMNISFIHSVPGVIALLGLLIASAPASARDTDHVLMKNGDHFVGELRRRLPEDLKRLGINTGMEEMVVKLASLAKQSGMDGVVASPWEIKAIREACGKDFTIVTPGIRPAASSKDDQKRIMTPLEAVNAGADYIVVGRPITQAEDPLAAAQSINNELC